MEIENESNRNRVGRTRARAFQLDLYQYQFLSKHRINGIKTKLPHANSESININNTWMIIDTKMNQFYIALTRSLSGLCL